MKVAQIRIKKIRFHVVCAVHTVLGNQIGDIYEQNILIWFTFARSLK